MARQYFLLCDCIPLFCSSAIFYSTNYFLLLLVFLDFYRDSCGCCYCCCHFGTMKHAKYLPNCNNRFTRLRYLSQVLRCLEDSPLKEGQNPNNNNNNYNNTFCLNLSLFANLLSFNPFHKLSFYQIKSFLTFFSFFNSFCYFFIFIFTSFCSHFSFSFIIFNLNELNLSHIQIFAKQLLDKSSRTFNRKYSTNTTL